ncbi:rhodanese-like domain-containing protein [Alteromonas sp. ASW11-130]|uniref:rhodanese-like domain-containing protein n=1 Tax=Alteromonas sp. ASW11-130 TaxID=3015775 RepID=UPI0022426B7C|nr:rhodanese-like domain-containing protein [Alteromonas sp. ASW11-130]MCW8090274.1 rhodanese-like domain-containing protein [Alteromonas sp. ASW11-130]
MQQRLQSISPTVRKVTAKEAAKECAKNNGTVIDVREPSECETSPSTANINIPRGVLEMKVVEQFKNPDHPFYIHCASGVRAQLAAEQLLKMGYTTVNAITCDIKTIEHINFAE